MVTITLDQAQRRPLRVVRRSLRKDGTDPALPWVFRCGCGLRSQCATYHVGRMRLLGHRCEEWHG